MANATIRKLEARINELENDKASLITAIRIVQEDENNSQYTSQKIRNGFDTRVNTNTWAELKTNLKENSKGNKRKRKRDHGNSSASNVVADSRFHPLNNQVLDETNTSTVFEIPSQEDEDNRSQNVESNNSSKVIIAGDSMLKHLNGFRMSTRKSKVQVLTFPGCTTLDMEDHIKPILRKKPA